MPTTMFTLACFIAVVLSAGCTQVEVKPYPPNMVYLDDDNIESAMQRLNTSMWTINDIFDNNEHISSYERERIISLLQQMEEEAIQLGAGTQKTNHLFIDENIDQFKYDIEAARKAVAAEPPNYYLAGRLSGSCIACHVRR